MCSRGRLRMNLPRSMPTPGTIPTPRGHKRLRGKRVSDWVIVSLNYAAWLVRSGAVAFVLLRG